MTTHAARSPTNAGQIECHAYPTTKSGIAMGSTKRNVQTRRSGRFVRSTHQAAAVPITAVEAVTRTANSTVLRRSSADNGRSSTRCNSDQPRSLACTRRKISGSSSPAAISALARYKASCGGRGRRLARTARAAAAKRPLGPVSELRAVVRAVRPVARVSPPPCRLRSGPN